MRTELTLTCVVLHHVLIVSVGGRVSQVLHGGCGSSSRRMAPREQVSELSGRRLHVLRVSLGLWHTTDMTKIIKISPMTCSIGIENSKRILSRFAFDKVMRCMDPFPGQKSIVVKLVYRAVRGPRSKHTTEESFLWQLWYKLHMKLNSFKLKGQVGLEYQMNFWSYSSVRGQSIGPSLCHTLFSSFSPIFISLE